MICVPLLFADLQESQTSWTLNYLSGSHAVTLPGFPLIIANFKELVASKEAQVLFLSFHFHNFTAGHQV